MEKIKVMLVEDDLDWIDGLKRFLAVHERIDLFASVSSLADCFAVLRNVHTDIIIMDIMLCDDELSGLDATLDITAAFPHIKVIMLSSIDGNDDIFNEAFLNGAFEYVYKQDVEQLPDVIMAAMTNPTHKHGDRLRKLVYEKKKSLLSDKDIQLLRLIEEDKTQIEIAAQLNVTLAAVKKRVGRILKKMNWQQSSKLLADKCFKWGLLDTSLCSLTASDNLSHSSRGYS